jgi:hypothetical protein
MEMLIRNVSLRIRNPFSGKSFRNSGGVKISLPANKMTNVNIQSQGLIDRDTFAKNITPFFLTFKKVSVDIFPHENAIDPHWLSLLASNGYLNEKGEITRNFDGKKEHFAISNDGNENTAEVYFRIIKEMWAVRSPFVIQQIARGLGSITERTKLDFMSNMGTSRSIDGDKAPTIKDIMLLFHSNNARGVRVEVRSTINIEQMTGLDNYKLDYLGFDFSGIGGKMDLPTYSTTIRFK